MVYMKSTRRRTYQMTARAEAAEETARRVLEAATRLLGERLYDEVSLADIAAEGGVTVQTVLRRFGSKEGLADAAIAHGTAAVREARWAAPVGDAAGAVANLLEHYEAWGDRSVLFLSQADRVPPMKRLTEGGRELHHAWVDHVFAPWLAARSGDDRSRLRARLIAATDVYVWKIVRRDLGFDRATTETTLRELVLAILA